MRSPFSSSVNQALKGFLLNPIFWPLRRLYSGRATCVQYHRIVDRHIPSSEFSLDTHLAVPFDSFEAQIKYLAENFNCIDLPTAVEKMQAGTLTAKSAIVTFDDGYRDNLTLGLPILEKYGVPATVYVCTGLVNRSVRMWWYEGANVIANVSEVYFTQEGIKRTLSTRTAAEKYNALDTIFQYFFTLPPSDQLTLIDEMAGQITTPFSYDDLMMTWDEVREIAAHPLITIGAHTVSHPVMRALTDEEMARECQESRHELEQQLGTPVKHFCYPYGAALHVGEREFQACANLGFDSAVTTRVGHIHTQHKEALHALPRILLGYHDSFDRFLWRLSGLEAMIAHRGQRVVTS